MGRRADGSTYVVLACGLIWVCGVGSSWSAPLDQPHVDKSWHAGSSLWTDPIATHMVCRVRRFGATELKYGIVLLLLLQSLTPSHHGTFLNYSFGTYVLPGMHIELCTCATRAQPTSYIQASLDMKGSQTVYKHRK